MQVLSGKPAPPSAPVAVTVMLDTPAGTPKIDSPTAVNVLICVAALAADALIAITSSQTLATQTTAPPRATPKRIARRTDLRRATAITRRQTPHSQPISSTPHGDPHTW